jgi:hypothetical protein
LFVDQRIRIVVSIKKRKEGKKVHFLENVFGKLQPALKSDGQLDRRFESRNDNE